MTAYYNEHDRYAAQWLRNLIDAGHIARGVVDERDIRAVHPADLDGFTQCHFFAGIGVWSHALRLAGWPDDRPVWTGSCPCQPFSAAGKGAGFADERHLWPAWHHLISERRPPVVFGEQVAKAAEWIDLVHSDMEAMDYAFGCVPIEAACAGSFHRRDRAFFVAHADSDGRLESDPFLLSRRQDKAGCTPAWRMPWADVERIECPDGKTRLRQPALELLADGHPAELEQLRAYGNAIVAQVAAEFIGAYLDVRHPDSRPPSMASDSHGHAASE